MIKVQLYTTLHLLNTPPQHPSAEFQYPSLYLLHHCHSDCHVTLAVGQVTSSLAMSSHGNSESSCQASAEIKQETFIIMFTMNISKYVSVQYVYVSYTCKLSEL